MEQLFLILLFTLSCNLDTFLLTVHRTLEGGPLSLRAALAVAAVTSAVTGVSLLAGGLADGLLRGAAGVLGSIILIVMGLWSAADALIRPARPAAPRTGGDLALALALAANNAAAGAAAGAGGLDAATGTAVNFAVTLALIALGGRLALRLRSGRQGRYLLPLSGLLLAALGALTLLRKA